jgi:glycosyltransferase involved in cell wall biosynthesis
MKILQVIHGFLPQFRGGTELYLRGLCQELRRRDQEVSVFTGTTHSADEARVEHYDFDGMQVAQLVLSGSYLEHWTRGYSPDAARLFAEELRRIRPDLVHVHHWFRLTRNLLETCYRLGIPTVCTLHDLYATCPSFFRVIEGSFTEAPLDDPMWVKALPRLPWMDDAEVRDEIERFRADFANEMQLAHRIIVPSAAHGQLVSRLLELPEERLVVMPHGTITPPPPAELEVLDPPAEGESIRLGYWGHLFHMKGPHLLLEAVKATGQAERFELHIWGKVVEPQYRDRLRAAAEGLDVRWYGPFVPEDIEKVPLDLAVIPSSCSESYSFVLDEAFRLGLPALVSGRGALAERLQGAGATFEPESSDDLARVLKEVAAAPQCIETWRDRVPDLTSMSDHAQAMLELYADVLRKRDMSRLSPDLELPRARTEAFARRLQDRERAMFSYLGRIKREVGRGDHYEQVVEQMIAKEHELGARANHAEAELETLRRVAADRARLIETMGREVADLREALALPPGVEPRPEPSVPEIGEHVPGLGPVAAIVRENQRALVRFARREEEGEVSRRDEIIAYLAGEILSLREGIRRSLDGEADFEVAANTAPEDPLDVPRLGDPATISAENTKFLDALREGLRERLAQENRRLGLLGREIEILRDALDCLRPDCRIKSSVILSSVLESEDCDQVPGFERIAPYLQGGPEALYEFRERLLEVRRSSERVEHVSRELEEKHRQHVQELLTERADEAEALLTARDEEVELLSGDTAAEIEILKLEQSETLAAVAKLIIELREALALAGRDDPQRPPRPEFDAEKLPPAHLPELGDLATIQAGNDQIIEHYLERLRQFEAARARQGEGEKLVRGLAREVELLRRALGHIGNPKADFEAPPVTTEESEVHVEGLGSLGQIRDEDARMVEDYLRALKGSRRRWF